MKSEQDTEEEPKTGKILRQFSVDKIKKLNEICRQKNNEKLMDNELNKILILNKYILIQQFLDDDKINRLSDDIKLYFLRVLCSMLSENEFLFMLASFNENSYYFETIKKEFGSIELFHEEVFNLKKKTGEIYSLIEEKLNLSTKNSKEEPKQLTKI